MDLIDAFYWCHISVRYINSEAVIGRYVYLLVPIVRCLDYWHIEIQTKNDIQQQSKMGILDKLFAQIDLESPVVEREPQQSVIITFYYGLDDICYLHDLEEKLRVVLDGLDVGEWDGHDLAWDNTDGSLYFYGPNAETLFKAIKPTLEATEFLIGATANLRFGPLGQQASEIDLIIGKH
ncbi:MAG: hypothetical protein K0Q95_237 [Bacteroidota bacterium]|jgi:hypothetical protein|nr:hypothetical protein [Bacteroidota bacterium]